MFFSYRSAFDTRTLSRFASVLLIDKTAAGSVWINVEKLPGGAHAEELPALPPVLVAFAASRLKSEKEFWQQDKISE
jgi:hypothetical protein